jgi:uncharacterized protein
MSGMNITVLKKNLAGDVTWQYEGRVLRHEPNAVVLEAFFNRPDMPFMDVVFKENDRFVETFYTDRWYNIFEVHDRDDDHIKGWYCNIGEPAVIEDGSVSYIDLALDLWVSELGKQTVLDEDEFNMLGLDDITMRKARNAIDELRRWFKKNNPPK